MGKPDDVVESRFSICDACFDMESLLPTQVDEDILAILWVTANPSFTQSRSSRSIAGGLLLLWLAMKVRRSEEPQS